MCQDNPEIPKDDSAIILWLRKDLRLSAHPAWQAAIAQKRPVIAVYIWNPKEEEPWPIGEASRWWLNKSLDRLQHDLQSIGSRLIFRSGDSRAELLEIAKTCGSKTIFWSRQYEPHLKNRDQKLKQDLQDLGFTVQSFNSSLLVEPWDILNQTKKPYQVFTAYWKKLEHCVVLPKPYRLRDALQPVKKWPSSLKLSDLEIAPKHPWHKKLEQHWQPGETQALHRLKNFIDNSASNYAIKRDFMAEDITSRLSPHLHFGEISPLQIWDTVKKTYLFTKQKTGLTKNLQSFLREIAWREFSYYLMYHFPHMVHAPLQEKFKNFPWDNSNRHLQSWQKGRTGYPIVDAGLRELWETGFMHNRVRMIVASFLTKDLFVSWQKGAAWFWETLVDADLANNTQGWQWTAGCGADAAPYFRIFNPVLQSEKFDPDGTYIRRWLPELKKLPAPWIHKPFLATPKLLQQYDVFLGKTYPNPIVDHGNAREHALAVWKTLSS